MSLDTVELIYEFERHFNIEIPDEVTERIYTLQDIADYIHSIKSKENVDKKFIENEVVKLVSEKLSIPLSEIELYHSIANDLGID